MTEKNDMDELAVHAEQLTKAYTLYPTQRDRLRDVMGWRRRGGAEFPTHLAVDRIYLKIRPGEKVGFIGRNGAGKSTLLKLVTNVIEPTSGNLRVNGETHALLQMGAGFHADFTGRENALGYLANLGVLGERADELVEEIIDFSELEEYIDQPLKTYSTGMQMRLIFTASTTVAPKLFVIDEVLGVGDAYFQQKSFERLQELVEKNKTTLLLVSHDVYSTSRICDRIIWLDRGSILLDSDAKSVIHRYEESIRDQQEARLRRKHMKALAENRKADAGNAQGKLLFGQIRCEGNVPIDQDLPIAALRVFGPQGELCHIEPGSVAPGDPVQLYLQEGEHNWGEPAEESDRAFRSFTRRGSIYHRAPVLFDVEGLKGLLDQGEVEIEVEYCDTTATPCLFELFHGEGWTRSWLRLDNQGGGEWRSHRAKLTTGTELEVGQENSHRYGTQNFIIKNIEFIAENGEPSHVYDVGDSLRIRLHYEIKDPGFHQRPVIQINFMKDGTARSHRFTLEGQMFDYSDKPEGEMEIFADPLLLGPGTYLVNVVVMSEGGYSPTAKKAFFTANDALLDHHSRAYELEIRPTNNILANDVVFLHPAVWKRDGRVVYEGIYPLNKRSKQT